MKPTPIGKVVGASMVGTTIEWYDFFLYGSAAALVFNKLFFPESEPLTGTLLAFLTYAVGFVARPLGGLVFGHYGDRLGRKTLLVISLLPARSVEGRWPGSSGLGRSSTVGSASGPSRPSGGWAVRCR